MLKPPPINPEILFKAFQDVGFALWQIQELENTLAHYLVIVHKVEPGVAKDVAEEILEKTRKKTLGQLVNDLRSKEKVPTELLERLEGFIEHRNWLAHHSRGESRKHLYQEELHHVFFDRSNGLQTRHYPLERHFAKRLQGMW